MVDLHVTNLEDELDDIVREGVLDKHFRIICHCEHQRLLLFLARTGCSGGLRFFCCCNTLLHDTTTVFEASNHLVLADHSIVDELPVHRLPALQDLLQYVAPIDVLG